MPGEPDNHRRSARAAGAARRRTPAGRFGFARASATVSPPMPYPTDPLRALDKQFLWHPFTHMKQWLADEHQPLVSTAAEGMELIDSGGNRYLDGVSSLWANVHGHRVPEIDSAIRAQLDKVA